MLELRCFGEFICRNGQVGTVYFVLQVNRVVKYLVQVISYILSTLPGRGRYPHQSFLRLEDNGMMSNELIDSHFVSQSQVRILQTLVVAQDRGGLGGVYRHIFIDEFFQSCKTVWTVRSTDIFHVSFIFTEFLRLVMIGADEPVGFFSFKEHCLLRRFLDDSGFAIFGRTYQDGFGDECLPFLCDGKSLINR